MRKRGGMMKNNFLVGMGMVMVTMMMMMMMVTVVVAEKMMMMTPQKIPPLFFLLGVCRQRQPPDPYEVLVLGAGKL